MSKNDENWVESFIFEFVIHIEEYLKKEKLDFETPPTDGKNIEKRYVLVDGHLDVIDEGDSVRVAWNPVGDKIKNKVFFDLTFSSLNNFDVFSKYLSIFRVSNSLPNVKGWLTKNHKHSDVKGLLFDWLKTIDIY